MDVTPWYWVTQDSDVPVHYTHSLFLSFTPFLTLRNTPAMLSAALRRGPRGKELREPLANSQGGTEALNPTGTETASHQQSHKWT